MNRFVKYDYEEGILKSEDELKECLKIEREYNPENGLKGHYDQVYAGWQKAV